MESKRYRADDGRQIASPYTSAPRGGGYHILCEHPDGFVPPRLGVVLLGVCHAPLDVSGCITSRMGAWLTEPSLTSTKHIMYNPAGAWPLTFPCSKYTFFLTFTQMLIPTSQLALLRPSPFSETYLNLTRSGSFKPFSRDTFVSHFCFFSLPGCTASWYLRTLRFSPPGASSSRKRTIT